MLTNIKVTIVSVISNFIAPPLGSHLSDPSGLFGQRTAMLPEYKMGVFFSVSAGEYPILRQRKQMPAAIIIPIICDVMINNAYGKFLAKDSFGVLINVPTVTAGLKCAP